MFLLRFPASKLLGTMQQCLTACAAAAGPFLLDLGDVLYAPNCFRDDTGRLLMVGWMQEGASRDSSLFEYSGCLSLPRVLTQQGEPQAVLQVPPLRWDWG